MSAEFFTSGEAARVLDITPDGVRWLERVGKLRAAAVTARGMRLFSAVDVVALAEARANRRGK